MLNSLPVLFPSTVLASAGQDVARLSSAAQPVDKFEAVVLHSLLPQSFQDTAVLHSLLLLSSDTFALLPCTVLAGDAR